MSSMISVNVSGGDIAVKSPYNSEFVIGARRLAGRFAGGVWRFDGRNEAAVRDLCRECYGTDGDSEPDVVSVRVALTVGEEADRSGIEVGGRTIARAVGRDTGARLGDGVVLESGGFGSGGSAKNWLTTVKPGTVVVMHDFPRSAVESARQAGWSIDVIDASPVTIDAVALMAERQRLLDRIAEIDAVLGVQ